MPSVFQLISFENRAPDAIIHKILRVSDLKVRNPQGHTILFKAISNNCSKQFIKALIKYGVNVAARDEKGRTTRDHSEILRKRSYFTDIDEHIIEIVQNCDIEKLQQLVLEGYDHIVDVTDSRGINIVSMLKQYHTLNPNKGEMLMLMERTPAIQVITLDTSSL